MSYLHFGSSALRIALPHPSSYKSTARDHGLAVPAGYQLRAYEEIDSTNEEARRLAQGVRAQPTWIWAERQTAGRGRRGRAWVSEAGNLFCTLLLPLEQELTSAAQLSFVSALAVGQLIEDLSEDSTVRLKWPNDVLLNGQKVSGILLESINVTGGHFNFLAIGIGINLASHPTVTDFPATSLLSVSTPPQSGAVLERLMPLFDKFYRCWTGQGFGAIRDAWLAKAAGLGETIEVRLPNETLSGVFDNISNIGELQLILPDGEMRKIAAGEVFFGPQG